MPLFIPTTSTTTPDGCVGGGGTWGEASSLPCSASAQRRWTMEWATPGSLHGRRQRTSRTQLQCTYFWHKCKCCTARGCKRRPPWWSGCVSCVHSHFFFHVPWWGHYVTMCQRIDVTDRYQLQWLYHQCNASEAITTTHIR